VVPKSVTPARIKKNLQIIDLDSDDLAALAEISKDGVKRYVYPAFGVDLKFPDKK
jgi:diketogulonate reductase-like aldo/keto reductase